MLDDLLRVSSKFFVPEKNYFSHLDSACWTFHWYLHEKNENIRNMYAALTNRIVDILHFSSKASYTVQYLDWGTGSCEQIFSA